MAYLFSDGDSIEVTNQLPGSEDLGHPGGAPRMSRRMRLGGLGFQVVASYFLVEGGAVDLEPVGDEQAVIVVTAPCTRGGATLHAAIHAKNTTQCTKRGRRCSPALNANREEPVGRSLDVPAGRGYADPPSGRTYV